MSPQVICFLLNYCVNALWESLQPLTKIKHLAMTLSSQAPPVMLHNLKWHVVPLLQSPRCVPADCWPGVRSRLRVTEAWTSPTSRLRGGTAWPSVLSYTTRGLTSCKTTGNTCGCWQLFRPRCFFFFLFHKRVKSHLQLSLNWAA